MRILSVIISGFISLSVATSEGAPKVGTLFKEKKPIIGVVNLRALPGNKEFVSVEKTIEDAMKEVAILEDAGVDGVLFENPNGEIWNVKPGVVETMTAVVKEAVKRHKKIVVGVEVLWHNPKSSLAIAKSAGAKFIRTDFFSDKVIAGGKVIDQDPKELIDYRKNLAAEKDIAIFTDIQVKYSEMVDKTITIEQSAAKARAEKSDGLIVTSHKSGTPPEKEKLINAKKGAKDLEIIIGSGFSVKNLEELFPHTDAIIVGTSISTGTGGTLIKEKVVELMTAVKKLRQK